MRRAAITAVVIAGCGRVGFDGVVDDRDASIANDAPIFVECTTRAALPVPASGRVNGSLTLGGSTTQGTCSGDATDEVVYQLDVTQIGSRIQVAADEGANREVAMYVRTACDAPETELECDFEDGIADAPLITRAVPPGRYFVFVDGQNGTNGGDFTAALTVLLPLGATCEPDHARDRCGPSLGCIAGTCQPESCDSAEVLGGSSPFVVIANTGAERNLHGGTCGDGGDGGSRGNEKIYRLDLAASVSNMNVSTESPDTDFDTLVYVRAGCNGTQLACNDDATPDNGSIVDTGPLVPGTYFIFVDAFGPQSGLATVTITLTP